VPKKRRGRPPSRDKGGEDTAPKPAGIAEMWGSSAPKLSGNAGASSTSHAERASQGAASAPLASQASAAGASSDGMLSQGGEEEDEAPASQEQLAELAAAFAATA
jgi:hypothetical protein